MIHNYDSGEQPSGQTWDTRQMQEDFEPLGFCAPYIVVRRRADGVKGLLEFTHNPRVYFNFVEDKSSTVKGGVTSNEGVL